MAGFFTSNSREISLICISICNRREGISINPEAVGDEAGGDAVKITQQEARSEPVQPTPDMALAGFVAEQTFRKQK